jgi:hypothetical protein
LEDLVHELDPYDVHELEIIDFVFENFIAKASADHELLILDVEELVRMSIANVTV